MMNLYRQHFYQCIEVLRFGKSIKIPTPRKEIKLPRKNPNFKTVYLDMDETLIHCDETSNIYTVKLNFPLERGGVLAVSSLLYRLESEYVPFARNSLKDYLNSRRLSSLRPVAHRTPMWCWTISTLKRSISLIGSTASIALFRRAISSKTYEWSTVGWKIPCLSITRPTAISCNPKMPSPLSPFITTIKIANFKSC